MNSFLFINVFVYLYPLTLSVTTVVTTDPCLCILDTGTQVKCHIS